MKFFILFALTLMSTAVFSQEKQTALWKDEVSGLIWSDRLPNFLAPNFPGYSPLFSMNQLDAIETCENFATTEIPKGSWKLPSIDELKEASNNGFYVAFPEMKNYWFWSSTLSLNPKNTGLALVFYPDNGGVGTFDRKFVTHSVICVTR